MYFSCVAESAGMLRACLQTNDPFHHTPLSHFSLSLRVPPPAPKYVIPIDQILVFTDCTRMLLPCRDTFHVLLHLTWHIRLAKHIAPPALHGTNTSICATLHFSGRTVVVMPYGHQQCLPVELGWHRALVVLTAPPALHLPTPTQYGARVSVPCAHLRKCRVTQALIWDV